LFDLFLIVIPEAVIPRCEIVETVNPTFFARRRSILPFLLPDLPPPLTLSSTRNKMFLAGLICCFLFRPFPSIDALCSFVSLDPVGPLSPIVRFLLCWLRSSIPSVLFSCRSPSGHTFPPLLPILRWTRTLSHFFSSMNGPWYHPDSHWCDARLFFCPCDCGCFFGMVASAQVSGPLLWQRSSPPHPFNHKYPLFTKDYVFLSDDVQCWGIPPRWHPRYTFLFSCRLFNLLFFCCGASLPETLFPAPLCFYSAF